MPKTIEKSNPLSKIPKSLYAGAVASLLTQPFEVVKTNMIATPTLYFRDLHVKIIKKGWNQYMRGGTLAVVRQAYGFTIYTSIIKYLNKKLDTVVDTNKYYKYSISALVGKLTAMTFESPLTLLKTRMQVLSNSTIRQQAWQIMKNPRKQILKGLNATIARQCMYSLLQYNIYRFVKDDILKSDNKFTTTFFSAFIAGTAAICASQPFQVLRSRVSLEANTKMTECARKIMKVQGWRGFFIGFMPRLMRKPINSGICWSILESFGQ